MSSSATPQSTVSVQPVTAPEPSTLVLAGTGWWWTARQMWGMDNGPWTGLGALSWFEERPLSEGATAFAAIDQGSTPAAKIILRP